MKKTKEINKTWKVRKKAKVVDTWEQKVLNKESEEKLVENFRKIFRKTEYATLKDINEVFKDSRYYRNRAKYIKIPKYILKEKTDVVKYILGSEFLNTYPKKQYQINVLTLLIAQKRREEFDKSVSALREDFIYNKKLLRKKMITTLIVYFVWLLLAIYWSVYESIFSVCLWIIIMLFIAGSLWYVNIKNKKAMDELREKSIPDLKHYNNKEYNVSIIQYDS